jgi:oxygen-independent coproporphyrinogen-3 oxidase
MYGFPEETLAEWQSDIDAALDIGAEHISAYSLMYEEGTRLFKMMEQGLVKEIAEELSLEMYNLLIDRLEAAGYEHYEISNFARQGFRSRHNSSYWQGIPYIGLGAAAHSFDLSSRQWNVSDIGRYIHSIESGKIPMEREWLDENTRYNDTVMLSLRTCEGIDMEELEKAFGSKHAEYCKQAAERFVNQQLLITDGHRLRLSRKGLFVSDMIMSELMRI